MADALAFRLVRGDRLIAEATSPEGVELALSTIAREEEWRPGTEAVIERRHPDGSLAWVQVRRYLGAGVIG